MSVFMGSRSKRHLSVPRTITTHSEPGPTFQLLEFSTNYPFHRSHWVFLLPCSMGPDMHWLQFPPLISPSDQTGQNWTQQGRHLHLPLVQSLHLGCRLRWFQLNWQRSREGCLQVNSNFQKYCRIFTATPGHPWTTQHQGYRFWGERAASAGPVWHI